MSFSKLFGFALALVGTITTQNFAQSSINSKKITVVIDAGHGGKDNGCSADGYHEKDIALNLALKIGDAIYEQSKNVNIIFTRTEDDFIPLNSRSHLANNLQADLFISVHANSYSSERVRGSEIYVLGAHKNEDARRLAQRENKSMLLESESAQEEYRKLYESDEGHILMSSMSNDYLDQSIQLAGIIENHLKKINGHKSLGIKQANFAVLKNTMMPSILFEVGYMTNKNDLAKMMNNNELNKISQQFAKAIVEYCKNRGETKVLKDIVATAQSPVTQSASAQSSSRQQEAVPSSSALKASTQQQIAQTQSVQSSARNSSSVPTNNSTSKPKISEEIVKKYKKKTTPSIQTEKAKNTTVQNKANQTGRVQKAKSSQKKDMFSLQVATSYSEDLELNLKSLKSPKKVFQTKEGELYTYYVGYYETLEAANNDRILLKEAGYKGTFISKKTFATPSSTEKTEKSEKSYKLISY